MAPGRPKPSERPKGHEGAPALPFGAAVVPHSRGLTFT